MSDATVVNPPAKANAITKQEAVRQALAELGKDATRAAIQSFVKDHFGFEMTPDHISNCKNKLQDKKGKGKAKKPATAKAATQPAAPKTTAPKPAVAKAAAPKPSAKKPAAPKAASTPAGNGKTGEGISLTDIESVKGLVGRVGPDQLRSLVDLLAK